MTRETPRGPTSGAGVMLPARVVVLGLALDDVDLNGAVAAIDGFVSTRRRGYVLTPNVDHVVRLQRDPVFAAAYAGAACRLADGMPIVWASRLLGQPLRARVTGADLLPAVCERASMRGHSVFILGGAAGVAQRAATNLSSRFAGLRIAGTHTPPPGFGDDPQASQAAIDAVARARPDILIVGLGSPRQELWVHAHWERLAATVAICCGAAVDYAAETQIRAPVWLQRTGLEWFWRLVSEPRRLWRRYLVRDAAFLGIFLREWWRLRGKRRRQ